MSPHCRRRLLLESCTSPARPPCGRRCREGRTTAHPRTGACPHAWTPPGRSSPEHRDPSSLRFRARERHRRCLAGISRGCCCPLRSSNPVGTTPRRWQRDYLRQLWSQRYQEGRARNRHQCCCRQAEPSAAPIPRGILGDRARKCSEAKHFHGLGARLGGCCCWTHQLRGYLAPTSCYSRNRQHQWPSLTLRRVRNTPRGRASLEWHSKHKTVAREGACRCSCQAQCGTGHGDRTDHK